MFSNFFNKLLYKKEKTFVYTLHIYTDDTSFIEYVTEKTNLDVDDYLGEMLNYEFIKVNDWFINLKTIQSIKVDKIEAEILKKRRLNLSW